MPLADILGPSTQKSRTHLEKQLSPRPGAPALEGSLLTMTCRIWRSVVSIEQALLCLSLVGGLLVQILVPPLAAASQDPVTLPETMTHDDVIEFLRANDITTVESFIQALPPVHKRHFIAVFESGSPTADFISVGHPRIVSWGADAAFMVTWTTHPDAPGNDSVEFLEARPGEGRWRAGVIDFSGDSPRLRFPGSCASCHGEPVRPLWGATSVHEGTEEPHPRNDGTPLTGAQVALYETLAATTHPRLEPLEREGYSTDRRKVPLDGGVSPNWELSTMLVARHAEVLFARLKSERGRAAYYRFVESRVCDSVPAVPAARQSADVADVLIDVFSREQFNLALRSDTLEPIQGFNPQSVYRGDEYWGGSAILSRAILFLTLHDLLRRVGAVAELYRRTPVEDALSSDVPARYLVRYPVGEATLEQELIAAYEEFFVSRGQQSLDTRELRAVGPEYGHEFIGAHTRAFSARVCEVLRAGGDGGDRRRNRRPEAVGTLPDRTLEAGASPLVVDVASAFRDRDRDVLTYATESSAVSVAVVSVVSVAAAASGMVTVTPLSAGEAEVTVTATDVEGSNRTATQTFTVTVSCAYTVEPLHRDVLWTARTGQVAVTTTPGCAWTAASESDFLTVTSRADGVGTGAVAYTVAANADDPRTGAMTVAGQGVTVYQASPTAWTNDPIRPGVTPVRAIHFLELRARIDALRRDAGLPAYGWMDRLLPGVTPIRHVHLTELRAALAEAQAAAGRPASDPAAPAVTAGTSVIEAAHLTALRAAVGALEASPLRFCSPRRVAVTASGREAIGRYPLPGPLKCGPGAPPRKQVQTVLSVADGCHARDLVFLLHK